MTTTHYLWDFENDSYLMEKDEIGTQTAVYSNEPVPYGKLISQHLEVATYFHHFDAQGSTRAVTDENADVVEIATYSAFGETVVKASTITNPFGFRGALRLLRKLRNGGYLHSGENLCTRVGELVEHRSRCTSTWDEASLFLRGESTHAVSRSEWTHSYS